MKKPSDVNARRLYSKYKYKAQERGLEFSLTLEEFLKITSMDCYICGAAPSNKLHRKDRKNTPYIYNGIDRSDNGLGYTIDNVRPCCMRCNMIKRELTHDELIKHLMRMMGGLYEVIKHFR